MTQYSPKTIHLLSMLILMAFTSLDLNTHLHILHVKARSSQPQQAPAQLQVALAEQAGKTLTHKIRQVAMAQAVSD